MIELTVFDLFISCVFLLVFILCYVYLLGIKYLGNNCTDGVRSPYLLLQYQCQTIYVDHVPKKSNEKRNSLTERTKQVRGCMVWTTIVITNITQELKGHTNFAKVVWPFMRFNLNFICLTIISFCCLTSSSVFSDYLSGLAPKYNSAILTS